MRLNNAISHFGSVLDSWRGFLVNPNYIRRNRTITANCTTTMWPEKLGFEDLARLEQQRQYSFQAVDGSLFLLRYEFRDCGERVDRASLAFAKCEDAEMGLVSWIRVDLDREAARGLAHPACHLHGGPFSARIPVSTIPAPRQFVEFVMAWSYPAEFSQRRLGDDGRYADVGRRNWVNDREETFCEHLLSDTICHIHVPLSAG